MVLLPAQMSAFDILFIFFSFCVFLMQRYSISDEISLHVFQQLESLYVSAPS